MMTMSGVPVIKREGRGYSANTRYPFGRGHADKTQISNLLRSRYNSTCLCCLWREEEGAKLVAAYIVPRFKGGRAVEHNRQLLCTDCAETSSEYVVLDFREQNWRDKIAQLPINEQMIRVGLAEGGIFVPLHADFPLSYTASIYAELWELKSYLPEHIRSQFSAAWQAQDSYARGSIYRLTDVLEATDQALRSQYQQS